MKLRVLGCSGGIGGNQRATSLLLDRDALIDSGTGVNELSLTEISIDRPCFYPHSHLDHIACLPFMVDSACAIHGSRPKMLLNNQEFDF